MTLIEYLSDSETSLWGFTNQASIIGTALNIPVFQAPTEHIPECSTLNDFSSLSF